MLASSRIKSIQIVWKILKTHTIVHEIITNFYLSNSLMFQTMMIEWKPLFLVLRSEFCNMHTYALMFSIALEHFNFKNCTCFKFFTMFVGGGAIDMYVGLLWII
jgi:hypothetical protein